jgi:hypothetical protein
VELILVKPLSIECPDSGNQFPSGVSRPRAKMAKKFPIHPASPERICWGCDKYCAADSMACSAERTPHLAELFGDDWAEWAPGHSPGIPGRDEAMPQDRRSPSAFALPAEPIA